MCMSMPCTAVGLRTYKPSVVSVYSVTLNELLFPRLVQSSESPLKLASQHSAARPAKSQAFVSLV